MSSGAELLVDLKGLVPTPSGNGVFLHRSGKCIAIFVDGFVGSAINMFIQGIQKPRPLTHDLIGHLFQGLGVTVQKVVINDLQDETFYARIHLTQENELGRNVIEIDARPSDSIAIAIQQNCPIFVAEKVWEKADDMSWALQEGAVASAKTKPQVEDEDPMDVEELEKLLFGDEDEDPFSEDDIFADLEQEDEPEDEVEDDLFSFLEDEDDEDEDTSPGRKE